MKIFSASSRVFGIIVSLVIAFSLGVFVYAQTETPTPTVTSSASSNKSDQLKNLQDEIGKLEAKVSELRSQGQSLSSQISAMDSQISLTEARMNATKQEITDLTLDIDSANKRMQNLEGSLEEVSKTLLNRIVATYQIGGAKELQVLLSSDDVSDLASRANYLRLVQAHDKQLLYDMQQARNDYANQKLIFEDKKKKIEELKVQLEQYSAQLEVDKQTKKRLLDETKGQEQNYQRLLANARAEYEAIQNITAGKGIESEVRTVSQGERIASVISGPSCNSGGTHLHFIVSQNGSTHNPFSYLKPIDHNNCSGSSCGSNDGDSFSPSGSWEWPISGPIEFNQGYGSTWAVRNSYVGQIYSFHNGIDIHGSSLEVRAVQSGTLYQGSYTGGSGCRLRYVKVKHAEGGLDTLYLHINY